MNQKRRRRTPGKNKDQSLRAKLLAILASPKYQPLDKIGLSRELRVSADDRSELRGLLKTLEQEGHIARIRKDRYVLPQEADLVTGVIQVHQSGGAHVISKVADVPDLYVSAENTATAMNGDTVVARVEHEGARQGNRRREGRVIRVLQSANPTVVGTLQRTRKDFYYVIPDDPRLMHDVYVHPGREKLPKPPQIGDKVVVKLEPWESRHVNPEGEIIEVLGAASDPGVDLLSIVRKYRLPVEFPEAVTSEAERVPAQINAKELGNREDLRSQMILTIDPDDAKDFDDAVFVERTRNGWSLGVHIADVSHYVRPGSPLDREAAKRGNSVYLVDRVIPMLPEALSNGICSLRPREDRLTFSAFMEFDTAGKMRRTRFAKTVIRSAERLTYKQAYALLQKPPETPVAERLHTAWELASLLRKNRFRNGSLDLDFPEVKVWLDENKRPVRLERIENDISHQLIEEFMLSANEAVASETKKRLTASVYRIHEDPDPDKLAEYRDFIRSYDIQVGDLTQRRELMRVLEMIKGHPAEYAVKLALLKSLKRATYNTKPVGHFGLAKENYTHFTSPIRRYADLIVHRVLASLIGVPGVKPPSSTELPSTAEHISTTERTAADAEKESVQLKKLEYFQMQLNQQNPEAFDAVIVDVRNYGLLVELPAFLLTGLIHVSTLSDDFYEFDSTRLRFVGRKTRRTFAIADSLKVLVARVDIYKRQVDFFPAPEDAPKRGRRPANR